MKYQLAIQFSDEIITYDELIEMEDALIDAFKNDADIDGHDMGAGEINLFILTNTPEDTFNDARIVVEKMVSIEKYRAAYRDVEGKNYTVLWPPGLTKFKIA
jgi:hypothetical protein